MSAEYKEYGWEAGEAHMNARLWPSVLRLAAQTRTKGPRGERTTQPSCEEEVESKGLSVARATERSGASVDQWTGVSLEKAAESGETTVKSGELSVACGHEGGLRGKRVLDVGCGNGFMCGQFLRLGCEVTGIDLSEQGISKARAAFAGARFEVVSADDDLLKQLAVDPFDIVISTEVVEHLYSPRAWARACFAALKPGGRFVCTTPYHGYLKNLAISLAGKWDTHASPLWDGGHIKLWSKRTLFALLQEAGFRDLEFRGVGRLPGLWMTMVIAAERPQT